MKKVNEHSHTMSGRNKDDGEQVNSRSFPPARTIEERENQLTSLAYDLVEKRLRNGTATSQETVHFLRLGSHREKLDEKLAEQQIELAKAKVGSLQTAARMEKLYNNALSAFAGYKVPDTVVEDGDDYERENDSKDV